MTIESTNNEVIGCRNCQRLVAWREQVAREKTRRFADSDYWGKPVPGFGDPQAQLLIVGLAPAAHGANRTGRMFTGDRSGDWLYRALHKTGFASQPESVSRNDGLKLRNCYISVLCRCAPPANKPTPEEFNNCSRFLKAEISHFIKLWRETAKPGAILCLGQLSQRYTLQQLSDTGIEIPKPRPAFGHGEITDLSAGLRLFSSYHPSQQNTFTGKLTEPMFDAVFAAIQQFISQK